MIDRAIPRDGMTREQFAKIELLGRNIGLERDDIIAAVEGPIPGPGVPGRSRFLLAVNLVVVTIIVVAAVLLMWTVIDPETSPIRTYVPGSLYGIIKPEDFVNA
jgi:hypothetical protein